MKATVDVGLGAGILFPVGGRVLGMALPRLARRILGAVLIVLGVLTILLAGFLGAASWGQADERVLVAIAAVGVILVALGIWASPPALPPDAP